MSKKNVKKNFTEKTKENINDVITVKKVVSSDDIVYCNVEKEFQDSTNNKKLMRINDCYRTTRERAESLIDLGYLKYYDDQLIQEVAVVEGESTEDKEDDDEEEIPELTEEEKEFANNLMNSNKGEIPNE